MNSLLMVEFDASGVIKLLNGIVSLLSNIQIFIEDIALFFCHPL